MNYEKKYKEALNKAKELMKTSAAFDKFTIEHIFPELKESEDEKMRKGIIRNLEYLMDRAEGFVKDELRERIAWLEKQKEFVSADFDDVWETADCDELTAPLEKYSKDAIKNMCHAWYDKGIELERRNWLEKQGEQPRYNIGDVICDKLCTTLNKEAQPNMEIVDIRNGMYICDKGSFPVSQQDEYVLVGKKIDSKLNDDSASNELRTASFAHAEMEMKNQTFPDNLEFELIYTFEEGARWNAAQKSTWSEKYIADVFEEVGLAKIAIEQSNDALTIALQDAMIELSKFLPQQNFAWSEEDENIKEWIMSDINKLLALNRKSFVIADKEINWLKSLKDRVGCEANCTTTKEWRASWEQLDALQYVYRNSNPPLTDKLGWDSLKTLELLYQDLMKLK